MKNVFLLKFRAVLFFGPMIFRVLLKFDNCIVIMDHMCVGMVIFILDAPFSDIG
jgi:hypothetical protein